MHNFLVTNNTRDRRRSGFTMLELLIGFFIIGASSVVYFQAMHMFRKESVFFSEHYVASALLEKVLEQCYQETELNPHGVNALGLSDALGNPYPVTTHITDEQTVFFQQPAIKPQTMKNLHNMLENNFVLELSTEQKPGFYEITAGFSWSAQYGKGSSETYCRVLSAPGEKEVITDLELSDTAVEQRLVSRVFSAPGTTLSSNLGSIGAQELLMNLGHIYYTCFDLFSSAEFQRRCRDAEDLETGYSSNSEEFARCSQMYFDIARDLLHLMVHLKPRLEYVKSNLTFLDVIPFRERLVVEGYVDRGAQYYKQLRRIFLASVLKVSERFEQQLNHARTMRDQRLMVAQIFNFYRVLYVNRAYCEDVVTVNMAEQRIKSKYNLFLSRMNEYFAERDPAIQRMALQERGYIAANNIEDKYFLPRMLKELFADIEAFAAITL